MPAICREHVDAEAPGAGLCGEDGADGGAVSIQANLYCYCERLPPADEPRQKCATCAPITHSWMGSSCFASRESATLH